jgi:hypothetical protein
MIGRRIEHGRFSRGDSNPGGRAVSAIGHRPVHEEAYSRVTVVLLNRQVVYLDRLSADIRAATGTVVKRAEIIRGLIDALADSGQDLRDVRCEEDVKKRFLRCTASSAEELDAGKKDEEGSPGGLKAPP